MQKVIFFTKSVAVVGGKEKVLAQLAGYLAANGYSVSIITYDGSLQSVFPLHPSVNITTLPLRFLQHSKNNLPKLLAFLKDVKAYRAFKQVVDGGYLVATDQIIASVVFRAFKKKAADIIIWEHLSYTIHTSKVWLYLRKKIYPRVKLVVALNNEEAAWYKSQGCRVECIPNAVQQNNRAAVHAGSPVVWAGAITQEKGIDDVIQLGKLLKQHQQPVQIHVYGGGTDVDYFIKKVEDNGLANTVVYKNTVTDIAEIYSNAMGLLLTSKHECFPTVILEAFSYGIPAIAYNCPTGPRNIISDGVNGFLVMQGHAAGLYDAIIKLAQGQALLTEMSDNAYKASTAYIPENIYPRWKKIFA